MKVRLSFMLLVATALFGQPTIQVSVQKRESAAKQLAYARRLIALVPAAMLRSGYERHVAVANAAANLEAVERGWPHDRGAIVEANALLAKLYTDAEMPQNAIDAASHGLLAAPDDHRLHLALGIAHQRLGQITEADREFASADATFDETRGDPSRSVGELNTIAYFYETQKEYSESARVLRRMGNLSAATPLDRLVFSQRALEATLKTPDRQAARADLQQLRGAYHAMLGMPRSPGGQAIIDQAQAAIARYETLLK